SKEGYSFHGQIGREGDSQHNVCKGDGYDEKVDYENWHVDYGPSDVGCGCRNILGACTDEVERVTVYLSGEGCECRLGNRLECSEAGAASCREAECSK